jgi:hypothetical protein
MTSQAERSLIMSPFPSVQWKKNCGYGRLWEQMSTVTPGTCLLLGKKNIPDGDRKTANVHCFSFQLAESK